MGKLKPSGALNWKKTDNRELYIQRMKQDYAKEPNSQFVGEWKELSRKLRLFIFVDDNVLHMSMSHPTRYPTWDEMFRTRYKFFSDQIDFVMYLPRESEYVNVHENCFHLYQLRAGDAFAKAEPIGELVFEGAS